MVSSPASSGASRRMRLAKGSAARARAIARSRSGLSGWPPGTRCLRKIGSLTKRVANALTPSVLAVEEGLERVASRRRAEELGEGARFLVDPRDHLAPFAPQQPARSADRFRRLGGERPGISE